MTPEQPVPSISPSPTASGIGITAPFDAPDEAFLSLALDSSQPVPRGKIAYPPAFGV